MKNALVRATRPLLFVALGTVAACSGSDDPSKTPDTGGTLPPGDGTTVFTPPTDPGANGFLVTVSGEDLAVIGYDFAAGALADGDPPAFVDGWSIAFKHVIVTVGNVRLNENPEKDDGNPRDVDGVVAGNGNLYAVDATVGGSVIGKSGSPDEKTVAITSFARKNDGSSFDPTARYAFSYDLVAATSDAKIVNLDAEGLALYEQGKEKGWSMILAGTATYKGPAPEAGTVFASIPTEVDFTLGLTNPSSYVNCRNSDLTPVGDEFPRGVQTNPNGSTTVQVTVHTDHTFWDRLNVEGTPLHFDPIAAQASTYGSPASPGVVTSDDLASIDVTGFTTRSGEPLPARSLVSDYTAPAGQLKYDANGTTFAKPNSFASWLAYTAAAGGHMNADGECEVVNNFTP